MLKKTLRMCFKLFNGYLVNHKDRVIAVVDGYGDPLQPKYRSAK